MIFKETTGGAMVGRRKEFRLTQNGERKLRPGGLEEQFHSLPKLASEKASQSCRIVNILAGLGFLIFGPSCSLTDEI